MQITKHWNREHWIKLWTLIFVLTSSLSAHAEDTNLEFKPKLGKTYKFQRQCEIKCKFEGQKQGKNRGVDQSLKFSYEYSTRFEKNDNALRCQVTLTKFNISVTYKELEKDMKPKTLAWQADKDFKHDFVLLMNKAGSLEGDQIKEIKSLSAKLKEAGCKSKLTKVVSYYMFGVSNKAFHGSVFPPLEFEPDTKASQWNAKVNKLYGLSDFLLDDGNFVTETWNYQAKKLSEGQTEITAALKKIESERSFKRWGIQLKKVLPTTGKITVDTKTGMLTNSSVNYSFEYDIVREDTQQQGKFSKTETIKQLTP